MSEYQSGDEVRGPKGPDGKPWWILRCGEWQDTIARFRVNALITDPPYSQRMHKYQETTATRTTQDLRQLSYDYWDKKDVRQLIDWWSGRTSGWMACFTDHYFATVYERHYARNNRVKFAPVPCLQYRPRQTGDGPGSGATYLMVSRPRGKSWCQWGSLPCWYEAGNAGSSSRREGLHIGGKPLLLMRPIIKDYSKPGDLVCDPCAGYGSTLLAALIEGRRAVGSEADPDTFAKAVENLKKGWTPSLIDMASVMSKRKRWTGYKSAKEGQFAPPEDD